MLKIITKPLFVFTLALIATGFVAQHAAAIGVVGHGTYFGRYNNPMQSSVYLANAPAPVYAAPAPVYAAPAPVYQAPAPAYAAPSAYCPPACPPVCNPCPPPCDPCGPTNCYRPVAPVPVVAVPLSPRYPTITGGYSPQTGAIAPRPLFAPVRWP